MAIIEYDKSPNITTEQRLKSLADSVRRAFDELENNERFALPIKEGGTGAKTIAGARQNINFIGVNPIASVSGDTVENWIAFGTGHAYFDTVLLNSQPVQHGFLENIIATPKAVSQVFTSYTDGSVSRKWTRTGSTTYGFGSWIMQYDANTPQYIKISKTSDTTDYSTSYNYFDPFYGGVTVGIVRGNLTAEVTTFSTYGDRSNYAVRGVRIGAGISTVRINYSIRMTNNTDTRIALTGSLYRYRNGTSTMIASQSISIAEGRVCPCGSTITTVQEGDFIFLQGYKGLKANDVDVLGGNATQMTVEVIR